MLIPPQIGVVFYFHTHTHTRVKQLVWLKLTHYIGCEFLVHRVLFALRKESVLREHTLAVIWGDQVFRHPQNICCFFFFFIKCRTTRRNDRARGTAHLFGGKPWRAAEQWSNHRESDVVWQSRPNGGREKNHTKKSFHRLVVAISKSWREDFFFHIWPPMFTTNRKCQDATRQRTKRGGGIVHQLWLIPSLFHSHVSYRTLRRSQRYQAQAQRRNQLFLFSL